jgi:hypothetical protein
MRLHLTAEQTKNLRSELREIQARYATLSDENTRDDKSKSKLSITHLMSAEER